MPVVGWALPETDRNNNMAHNVYLCHTWIWIGPVLLCDATLDW